MVQIIAADLDDYYEKVSELRRLPYVWSIQSSVAIKEVKNTSVVLLSRRLPWLLINVESVGSVYFAVSGGP